MQEILEKACREIQEETRQVWNHGRSMKRVFQEEGLLTVLNAADG